MKTKNARILGIRLDAGDAQRLAHFERTTHVEGVALGRAALRAALDRFEATGTLTLPLRILAADNASSAETSPNPALNRRNRRITNRRQTTRRHPPSAAVGDTACG